MLFKGYGQVWNTSKNKLLCTFKNGTYETTDTIEIKLLQEMNFKTDEAPIDPPKEPETPEGKKTKLQK